MHILKKYSTCSLHSNPTGYFKLNCNSHLQIRFWNHIYFLFNLPIDIDITPGRNSERVCIFRHMGIEFNTFINPLGKACCKRDEKSNKVYYHNQPGCHWCFTGKLSEFAWTSKGLYNINSNLDWYEFSLNYRDVTTTSKHTWEIF